MNSTLDERTVLPITSKLVANPVRRNPLQVNLVATDIRGRFH